MARKLNVSLTKTPAMHVTRVSIGKKKKLVYVILSDKELKYPWGKSRIVYIGTTKHGVARFAQSAAVVSEKILGERGIRILTVRIVTCSPKPKVKSWMKLERGLLWVFRERFGEIPRCNSQGSKMKEEDEFKYFQRERLVKIVSELG